MLHFKPLHFKKIHWQKIIFILLAFIMVAGGTSSGIIIYLQNRMPNSNVLQPKIIKEGTGKTAKEGNNVSVLYKGSLPDGTVFDASANHDNQTLDFTLGGGQIIKGFEAAVIGMKEGEIKQVTLPPELAYGDKANGPIPANSTLIFEIELVKIN